MKWKTALTAEEAALFASDIDGFKTLVALRQSVISAKNPPPVAYTQGDIEDGLVDPEKEEADLAEFIGRAEMAEEIYEALLQEIVLADPYEQYTGNVASVLDVAIRAQHSEEMDFIYPEKCTVTKLSLAKWFWQHDHDIAKKFWPSITEELVYPPQPKQIKPSTNIEPAAKTKNAYLKTISSLSAALIGGLTGKPNTDAEAVLAALAEKAVEAPIGEKALANYLKDAGDL